MQAAGTLCGTRAISLLVLLVPLIGCAYSSPIQYLPSIPGYIPVYIRYGDEPLEGINPELAEAFGETSNSVKSSQKIDHTLAHESDNFNDDNLDTFLEESKNEHAYPLHVREAESRSFAAANDNGSGNSNKPKLLSIYTLPDDNDRPRRRYRGRSRIKNSRKRPAFKVSPLSDEKKEEVEKLAIDVEKEETKPNELHASNPRCNENTHSQEYTHKTRNFIAPIKVQVPFDETLTDLPKIQPQTNDIPQSNHNIATFEAEKEESPIKGQHPAIWSNVNKVSPINLLNENKSNKDTISEVEKVKEKPLTKIDLLEIPQDTDLSKSPDKHFSDFSQSNHDIATFETEKEEPPIKEQRPATIWSNVNKVSPINLLNENKSNKDTISEVEKVKEKPLTKIDLLEIPQDTDLSKSPDEHSSDFSQSNHDIATFETEKEEPPIKEQRPATIWSNVNKVSPIDLLNENKTNKDTISEVEKVKEKPLMKIDLLEIPQDTDLSKSPDEHCSDFSQSNHDIATAEANKREPPIKIQRPTTILSNVDKISPIDLPNENKTNEESETKDFTQHTDEAATD